jgi:signal transduction histidine kinase
MRNLTDKLFNAFEQLSSRFGGKNIFILAIALLVAVLTIVITDYLIMRIQDQNARIAIVRDNINELNQLKENLFRAETAQRGYLITLEQGFILSFDYALEKARENVVAIQKGVTRAISGVELVNTEESVDEISASLEAKATEMKLTLTLAQSDKLEEAKTVVKMGEGTEEADKLVALSETLIASEQKLLATLENNRAKSIFFTRVEIVFGSLLLISLVVFVISQQLKELSLKSKLQVKLAEENQRYEHEFKSQRKLLHQLALDHQSDAERERQKLARELHDELGSILTAAKMDITWTIKKVADTYPDIVDKLKKTNKYIDQGIGFKRQMVQDLHPSMIASFGFWPAIENFVEEVAERNHWELNFEIPEGNPELNETISLIAYRILQESLNNASKYAEASSVSVNMIMDEKYLKIEVTDNGIGTDLEALDSSTHGLSGMKHRVMAIGGRFEITSQPGKGMFTHALLPLDIHKFDY